MNNLFQLAPWFILIYAAVVLLGGIIGYLKAKSKVSLIMGLSSGVSLLVAWFLCGKMPVVGLGIATFIASVLLVVFIMRFFRTRVFMPAGLMMVFSFAATVVFALGLMTMGTSPA